MYYYLLCFAYTPWLRRQIQKKKKIAKDNVKEKTAYIFF